MFDQLPSSHIYSGIILLQICVSYNFQWAGNKKLDKH